MRNYLYLVLSVIVLFSSAGCKKEEAPLTENQKALYYINKAIYDAVNEYYLWYMNIPKTIDFRQEPFPFFYGLKYKEKDIWSFISSKSEFYVGFLGGNVSGSHGFDVQNDQNGRLRIAFVYPNTSAYKAGIRRGWTILKVNNQIPTSKNFYSLLSSSMVGSSDTFEFERNSANVKLELKKEDFIAPTVLAKDTLHVGNSIVGYLMFNEFRGEASQAELDSAFDFFNKAGATELVLDMRYNGGGMNETAHHLANLIAGKDNAGSVFVKYVYNDKLDQDYNESVPFKTLPNSINLPNKRIYIIATTHTASASEIMINCFKPYLSVYVIGSTTHGKPVGMNVLELKYYDYVLAPISFSSYNKNNEGDYFNGIAPDSPTEDDVTHDFGDPQELCLAQALAHIQTGSFKTTFKSQIQTKGEPFKLRKSYPFPLSINKVITIE